jgi:hypothetical protein
MRRPAVVGAAALVLAAAAAVTVVATLDSPETNDAAVVADAQGVTVILPNGEVIAPLAGEGLPVGAIVEAGANATGRIGDAVLVPRSRYIVGKDGLKIASSADPTPTPAPSIPTTTARATDTTTARPTTTAAPSQSSSTAPSPTPVPTTAVPTAPEAPSRLAVAATAKGKKARISWSGFGGTGVKQYVVVRVRSWNGSTLPKGKRIATVRRGSTLAAVDAHPQAGTFYVVAALGPKRIVLAIGSVRAPTFPTR